MRIMGIDQGIANMGYSILDDKALVAYGYISTNNKETIEQRLYSIYSRVEELILEYNPEIICCEKLFYTAPSGESRNKSASIIYTNMITGVLTCLAGKYGIEFRMFVPSMVKKAICNNGVAKKEEVIAKIKSMYSVQTLKSKAEHVCDSISIAYTCNKQNEENPEIRENFLISLSDRKQKSEENKIKLKALEDKRIKKEETEKSQAVKKSQKEKKK